MTGGKDWNKKTMEPLYPRLYVRDREKGGPKPPPRNKMAIYEELITPSSRPANGLTTILPLNLKGSDQIRHAGSSGQVGGPERRTFSAICCPPTSTHTTPRLVTSSQSDGILSNTSANSAAEPLRYAASCVSSSSCNEDKVESLDSGAKQRGLDWEMINSPAMNSSIQSQQTSSEIRLKRASVCDQDSEDDAKMSAGKKMALVSTVRANVVSHESSNPLWSDGVSKTPVEENNMTLKDLTTEQSRDSLLTTESRSGSLIGYKNGSPGNNIQCAGVAHQSVIRSLEDVVLKTGQENFWNIRRLLVNQERDFLIQVFELHRLVQVQRSLARSSHHFIEDSLYLHKRFHEMSNKDKLLTPPPPPPPPPPPLPILVQPNECLKTEAADNLLVNINSARESVHGKTTTSSMFMAHNPGTCFDLPLSPPPIEFKDLSFKNPIAPGNSLGKHRFPPLSSNSNKHSLSGNLQCIKSTSTSVCTNKIIPTPPPPAPLIQISNNTCFYPPPENQLLIPFMSSEGLVYKSMNLPSGGGSYILNTAYGIPASQQVKEVVPGIPITLSYLDPCRFSSTNPHPGEAFNHAGSNDSTGNSSVKDALSLFPLETSVVGQELESALCSGGSEKKMRTIKAVPRDGRLATESVMRVFESLQEERRQS